MNVNKQLFDGSIISSHADKRTFAKEKLIYNTTEDLLVFMENNGISKNELARRLWKSRSYVTQLLNGGRNMTLGTFSDICFELGFSPSISVPIAQANNAVTICSKNKTEYKEPRQAATRQHPEESVTL